jgi:ATP-dependent helicase/nuclease subunit B
MGDARVFLGWDRPFLEEAVEWLIDRKAALPGILVVVPTAQSGRRLREALAGHAGAVLAPQVVTPGWFLHTVAAEVAPDWAEQLAWLVALEEVGDWDEYSGLFPEPPETGEVNWARGLAVELVRLRRSLQENGMMLAGAARALAGSVEAERWQDLARLEGAVERVLRDWGLVSRSAELARGARLPDAQVQLVFVGVPDFPPVLERALAGWPGKFSVLIAAPAAEQGNFSPLGRPLDSWNQRPLPWPTGAHGSVVVAADPRQQASEALRLVATAGTDSDALALAAADVEVGDELARGFSRAGWPAFHPATAPATAGIARWLRVWSSWLADDQPAILADLLALPESARLVGGRRFQLARQLGKLRDSGVLSNHASFNHAVANQRDPQASQELLDARGTFQQWRGAMLGAEFPAALARLLERLGTGAGADEAARFADWLAAALPFIQRVRRDARFWIDLMLGAVAAAPVEPPAGRVVDVQGWLELLHEPGSHLVLCGMNDGRVPARGGGEPWLSEASRKPLGLVSDAQRAARDAYIYQAIVGWRLAGGRVDILCGRGGAGGEGLLPSRLLLAAERVSLPERVGELFREIEPPEAGMRWAQDWPWVPPLLDVREKLAVTKFKDFLGCPFRFYLQNVVGMWKRDADRREWSGRDFGSVAHEVLEQWGRDPQARDFSKAEVLEEWLSQALDRVVAARFGDEVPLGVAIQVESLRQRLAWFAREQACLAASGWVVEAIETPFELDLGGLLVSGKIDRIDRHRETGEARVIDYKTGKVNDVAGEHCKAIRAATRVPQHLAGPGCPALFSIGSKDYRWLDLQLPLYALAVFNQSGTLATPAYFALADSASKVRLDLWNDFDADHLHAAEACASWIAGQIRAQAFWPPAEDVRYDNLTELLPRGVVSEGFAAPDGWRLPPAPVAVPAAEAGAAEVDVSEPAV